MYDRQRQYDTKRHCQVCGVRLPRRNHSGRKRELCLRHNSAVNALVRWHKITVEKAVAMVRQKFLHREASA